MPTENDYTLQDLADLAGVTPRTIRFYIAQGLLPSPGRPGPGAAYSEGHLARLRLIRQLQRDHLPLAEIRARLAGLDDETVAALAEESGTPDPEPDTAADYIRRVLGGGPPATPGPLATPATPGTQAPPGTPAASAPFMRRSIGLPPFGDAAFVAMKASAPPAAASAPPPAFAVKPSSEPPSPDRSQWDRIVLVPDVELHVRRPLTRHLNKRVDRLIAIARELLEEDPS